MMKFGQFLILAAAAISPSEAFQPGLIPRHASALRADEEWTGEVVADADGRISGCTITPGESETEFTIQIDGEAADLGRFGTAVYKKITADAKRQEFQGFRRGTLPPHLIPSYRAFAMDEVAREATLEAMQQNNIRPFDSARQEMIIEQVSIPPKPKKKKKKKGGKKKKAVVEPLLEDDAPAPIVWETYETMQGALKAGWEPGVSFSFFAKVKGQKVDPVETERPSVI